MDRDEVARRLEKIRAVVREQLAMREPAAFDDTVRKEAPFHLPSGIGVVIGGDPQLAVTEDLQRANEAVDIFTPAAAQAPVVGPLINLLRRLVQPVVKVFLGGHLGRQREFNAHVVRHLNELGNRLEQRVRRLEEAIEVWSANPGGIDARVRKSLDDYDAALRQRHMTLFSALEEEVLVAHTAADRLQKLEERFVERAQAIDRRFAEKDDVLNRAITEGRRRAGELGEAVERIESQMSEVMAMRALLRKALESAASTPSGAPSSAPGVARAPRDATAARDGAADLGTAAAQGTKPAVSSRPAAAAAAGTAEGPAAAGEPGAWGEIGAWLDDEDYRSFQDRFRGDPQVIAERMLVHVARFEKVEGKVADLGCGRGEFLDLLHDAGIAAVGVEINAADVQECVRRGHDAVEADLFDWLERQADASLGGIFMAQVIEHMPPGDWRRFVELGARKLAAGGRVVIETINPESLYALTRAYVIDPTHVRPVHPELLAFLSRRAGLHPVEVEFQSPVPDDERPAGLRFFQEPPPADIADELAALREAAVRLDRICCAPQEYTLQATRPGPGESR